MNTTLETKTGRLLVGSRAFLVDNDRELAWAEKYVHHNKFLKWVVAAFVEADVPNDNGHIFPLADLEKQVGTLQYSPMNMLHSEHDIVGSYVAAEMIYPTGESATDTNYDNPYMESLSALWAYYFPEQTKTIERAHKAGALYTSMECVPESIGCTVCGQEYAYSGRVSPLYCADLQVAGAKRKLIVPHFTGGALVFPPARPAWKRAGVNELSALMAEYEDLAVEAHAQISAETPHLDDSQWENMVMEVVLQARLVDEGELARKFTEDQRKKMAKKGAALKDGSYPIATPEDLANAIKAFGRNPTSRVKSHIISRAKALGKTSMLPSDWKVN